VSSGSSRRATTACVSSSSSGSRIAIVYAWGAKHLRVGWFVLAKIQLSFSWSSNDPCHLLTLIYIGVAVVCLPVEWIGAGHIDNELRHADRTPVVSSAQVCELALDV
jgi:hypothetical protein